QTGEEITIPAQNKVVFSAYKKLSGHVNQPYAGMEPQILHEPDTEDESAAKPSGEGIALSGSLINKIQKSESEDSENDNDLLIERPHPGFKKEKKELEDFIIQEPEKGLHERKPVKRQKRREPYQWSYSAVILFFIVVIAAIYYFVNRAARIDVVVSPEPDPPAIEQIDPVVPETPDEPEPDEPEPWAEPEPEVPVRVTVESGQTLWTLAESRVGNPYLWPLIYEMNKADIDNPNQIIAGSSLTLPVIEDPENLTDQQLIDVATGYISVYQWVRSREPDEAKFFLWAAGVFSMETVLQFADEVNPADLEFAQRR
ncbi:MAG: hypothetical protein ACFCU6_02210, partial [Balneolaceae bacterium]